MSKPYIPSRRDFLKDGGALVVGFSLAGQLQDVFAQEGGATKPLALTAVDTFLAIDPMGTVTVYSGKVDLGTGVRTALAQIVAEELDVPFSRVKIVQGDTALTPDQGPTFGSLSIQIGGVQIRNAAAVAKSALLDLAVTRLGVTVSELTVADGVISGGGKQVSYGELIAGKAFSLTLDHQKPPATKDAKAFKIVGTSVPRLDIPDKVTGKFTYMHDFRVSGMLHGRVVRPPAIGAQLQSVDEASIQGIPGVVKIVRQGNFLGLVAENEWAAIKPPASSR
jgi:nicotinate dehydrogenase subunit B